MTGTSHLLAISGLHVGVLLGLTVGAGAWLLGRRRQLYLLLPLGAIWLYALLSGLSASVERAAIMGTFYLVALALGRPRSVLPILALAAAVMTGINPQALEDVSFQLSFAAVAGIALLASPLSQWLRNRTPSLAERRDWLGTLVRGIYVGMAVSLAATLATLPLVAFHFHRIPTISIPATLAALPVLPLLLLTSTIAAVVGIASEPLGQVAGWVAWLPLSYMSWVVHLFSLIPGGSLQVSGVSGVLVWAYYAAFGVLILSPYRLRLITLLKTVFKEKGLPPSAPQPVSGLKWYLAVGTVLLLASVFLWSKALAAPDGRLHVYFIDIGQGDSIFIVTPSGRQVLIDGGPDSMGAIRAIGGRMPFWDRTLDMVILTHPDQDHLQGLVEVLRRYRLDIVLSGPDRRETALFSQWEKAIQERGLSPTVAFAGQRIHLEDKLWLEVLHPPLEPLSGTGADSNNNSLVLRLHYKNLSILLTGDIEREAESWLVDGSLVLDSDVLKVPHHGSNSSTTPRFLEAVTPQIAIISAGEDNRFGHPAPQVVTRLEDWVGEERLFLTQRDGAVHLSTDGKKVWLQHSK